MTSRWRRVAVAAVVSAILLLILWRASSFDVRTFETVSLAHAALATFTGLVTIYLRSLNYRLIAKPEAVISVRRWLDVGVRHQLLFTLVPSGFGDVSFPLLAKKHAGAPYPMAVAVIALARLRDLFVLGALATIGLALVGHMRSLSIFAVIALLLAGYHVEYMIEPLTRLLGKFGYLKAWKEGSQAIISPAVQRGRRMGMSIAVWLMASISVWLAYRSANVYLSIGETFCLVAALNIAGLISITVGGLGVSETGSTAALLLFGMQLDEAIRISLTARPILLLSVLCACLTGWLIICLSRRCDHSAAQ